MENVKVQGVQTIDDLHVSINLTQKLKLMRRSGKFTYTPTQTNEVDRYFHS